MVKNKRSHEGDPNLSHKKILTTVQGTGKGTRVIITPTSNQYEVLTDNNNEVAIANTKKEKVPPITISGMDRATVHRSMTTLNVSDYHVKPMNDGVRIHCLSQASHTKVLQQLKSEKMNFFTHALPSEKKYRVVLSGLHKMDIPELVEELKQHKVTPSDVKIIQPRSPRFADHVNYILYFEKNTVNIQDLKNIKAVFHTIVKWEPYRNNKKGLTQCSVCQKPGHGGRHCHMPARCLYCAGQHTSAVCPTYLTAVNKAEGAVRNDGAPIEIGITAKCANCEGCHFASDPTCPARRKYLDERARARNHNRGPPRRNAHPAQDNEFNFDLSGRHIPNRMQIQAEPSQTGQGSRTWAQQVSEPAQSSPSDNLTLNSNPFSFEEVMSLTSDVLNGLQNIRSASRSEVIRVVMQVSLKYLYNDSRR